MKGGGFMYEYSKLKGLIKEHFDTQENFAKAMGFGTTTLTSRLGGKSYFDQAEIDRAVDLLKLTPKDINAVFFTRN